jgi:dTDP-4-dehydrorhamnose reductase
MKIAVIGADGQLGRDVVRAFEGNADEVYGLTHTEVEISNIDSVVKALQSALPDVVVNTAAMHHVERCEQDPCAAFDVNALGARNLAEATRALGILLMHISTDYVFDGNKREPYIESDAPLPLNVYGNTKLAGEHFVRTLNPKHFVLRTSALYGNAPCRGKGGLNFVELMLKVARERGKVRVVDSEVVSPTPTAELAQQIVVLCRTEAYGLYHATAEDSCSWFEFARAIFEVTNTAVQLEVAGPNEFPAKVPRPIYSVLENRALKAQGINLFKTWRECVSDYLGVRHAAIVPVSA